MISYNPKHFDKEFQAKANVWWRQFSINEMKALEKKYGIIYDTALKSEIAAIYEGETSLDNPNKDAKV